MMKKTKRDATSTAMAQETTPRELTAASTHEARLRRIRDYLNDSLNKNDPLEANVGAINSGLLRMALWLDETLENAMSDGTQNVDRLKRLLPAIEAQLKISRQVDRFAQIEIRAIEARKPKIPVDRQGILCTPTTTAKSE